MNSGSARRFAASASIACFALLAAPVRAFSETPLPDGSFEYFFAAPSLRIASTLDLDLGGLRFIEGVADGFRVGAAFPLEWLGGENARLTTASADWSGISSEPRRLDIVAGGSLSFGTVNISLAGGKISLQAGNAISLGTGSTLDVSAGGSLLLADRTGLYPRTPPIVAGSGTLTILPGGDVSLVGSSPVPEPTAWALLLAGIPLIAGLRRRVAH
jgi:hypothetical protein